MRDVIERYLVNVGSERKSSGENWVAGHRSTAETSAMTSRIQADCIIYSQVNIKTDTQTERKIQTVLLIEFLIG